MDYDSTEAMKQPEHDEVHEHEAALRGRLEQAEKSAEHHRFELRKAEVIAASCRAGLDALKEAQGQQREAGNSVAHF